MTTAFIIGNGKSRQHLDLNKLRPHGKIYACNAVYRTFEPDYLVAVDTKMVSEIDRHKWQHTHEVWTNPNKVFDKMKKGDVKANIYKKFKLNEAEEAHKTLQSRKSSGSIILEP